MSRQPNQVIVANRAISYPKRLTCDTNQVNLDYPSSKIKPKSSIQSQIIKQKRNDGCCSHVIVDDQLVANQISTLVLDLDKGKSFAESRKNQKLLRTIFSIYFKLIQLSPLDYSLIPSFRKSSQNKTQRKPYGHNDYYSLCDIHNPRTQVLNYIENLGGYSDSINTLRLILKSTSMVSVINAYEQIASLVVESWSNYN